MSIRERMLESFCDEMRKLSAVPWQALGRNVGALTGTGAALGAGVGLASGGLHSYEDARAQGAGIGQAALHGIGGGLSGGLHGAGVGSLLGAGLGAAGTFAAPELAGRVSKALSSGSLGSLGRFGQRQVHSLTGWTPEEGIESIHGGAYGAHEALSEAQKAVEALPAGASEKEKAKAMKGMLRAHAGLDAAKEVEQRGMTSLPGALKAYRKDPVGALRASAMNHWRNASGFDKALLIGAPVAGVAAGALSPEPGQSREEVIGSNLAMVGSQLGLGSLPIVGQLAGDAAANTVGKYVGRGIHKLHHPAQEPLPPDNTMNVPAERVMSPAAMGQAPELGGA